MPGMFNGPPERGEFGMSMPGGEDVSTTPPIEEDFEEDSTRFPQQRRTIFDDIAEDMEEEEELEGDDDEEGDEADDDGEDDDGEDDDDSPMVILSDGTEISADDLFDRQFGDRMRDMDVKEARLEERERLLGSPNGNGNNGGGGDQDQEEEEPFTFEPLDPNSEEFESDGERRLVGIVNQLGGVAAELRNENRALRSELDDVDHRTADTEMRSVVSGLEQEFGVTRQEMEAVADEFPRAGNLRMVAEVAKSRKATKTTNQSRSRKAQDNRTSRTRRVSGSSGSPGSKRVRSRESSGRIDYRDSQALARKFKAFA